MKIQHWLIIAGLILSCIFFGPKQKHGCNIMYKPVTYHSMKSSVLIRTLFSWQLQCKMYCLRETWYFSKALMCVKASELHKAIFFKRLLVLFKALSGACPRPPSSFLLWVASSHPVLALRGWEEPRKVVAPVESPEDPSSGRVEGNHSWMWCP